MRRILSILALSLFLAAPALADVSLPSIFGDNMVLQRDLPIPVWGTASPGEKVTVTLGSDSQSATASPDGHWRVNLSPLKAGGPLELTVSAANTLSFKNVLVGEVWLASGQSNMHMRVKQTENADAEIADATLPNIRLCTVEDISAAAPQDHLYAEWVECSPKTATNFSAVAFFFAKKLHADLGVPVGIIHASWSGTCVEAWISHASLAAIPDAKPLLAAWDDFLSVDSTAMAAEKAHFPSQFAAWQKEYAAAEPGVRPGAPNPPDPLYQRPSGDFNAMIAPVIPFGIRGVIWYQGEGNSERAVQYRSLFPALIRDWRSLWGEGDFPFLFVQLSSYTAAKPNPSDSEWAETREAQSMTLSLPNTAMAVSLDCGDAKQVHYLRKKPVGERLALAAEGTVYGKDVIYQGPTYDSMDAKDGKIAVRFKHTDGGLVAQSTDTLGGFQIAGADRKWFWADARIDGDTVVVSSPEVPSPVAVRYAWMTNALSANLANKAGLPASTFRTDDWPLMTDGVMVPSYMEDLLNSRK
jgi:sialate O-acetylesterase